MLQVPVVVQFNPLVIPFSWIPLTVADLKISPVCSWWSPHGRVIVLLCVLFDLDKYLWPAGDQVAICNDINEWMNE